MGFLNRLQHGFKHGWNAFINNRDPTTYQITGPSYYYRPDRPRFTRGNERSIVNSIFNRIAMDVADLDILHAIVNDDGLYVETKKSGLNNCLTVEANIDQTGRDFKQSLIMSMFDEGYVAAVPVDTTIDPTKSGAYDIHTLRAGQIIEWFPAHVKVKVYNENTGEKVDVILPKKTTAIIYNPLYSVINEPNSTLKRLIRKLNILDAIDEQSGSGRLDVIIQLPYVVKTDQRREQAKQRIENIEQQLKDSPFGIAYTDATERITQLNRPVENNLMKQIEYLTDMLYSQLGITKGVLDNTASEQEMLNYYNRTIVPIVSAIVDEFNRKFLTKTARSQNQKIVYFRDAFKLVPISQMAEIGDKFTRNKILTSNEVRSKIGFKPSKDPSADKLENANIRQPDSGTVPAEPTVEEPVIDERESFASMKVSELSK